MKRAGGGSETVERLESAVYDVSDVYMAIAIIYFAGCRLLREVLVV